MNFDYLNLINLIQEKKIVSHKEVTEKFGWSRYITNKYIDEINAYFKSEMHEIYIEYEPRIGISIKGEEAQLKNIISTLSYTSDGSKEKRVVQILSVLLDAKDFIKIQDLADMFFLSRSSIENTLEEIRSILKVRDIKIIGSKNGIRIDLKEDDKRELIANLINSYKSNLVIQNYYKEDFRITINFSKDIKSLIDLQTINKVIDITNEFMVATNLYLTEYEFSSLVIHISILIDRIRKNFIVEQKKSNQELETNSKKLIKTVEKKFKVKLPRFEQENINMYINSIQQNNYNKVEYTNKQKPEKTTMLKYEDDVQEMLSDLRPDAELIRDLAIHLRSAINRLKKNVSIRNPYLEDIKTRFMRAFEISMRTASDLEERYTVKFDEDEIAYIAIHIQSFFEREKKINKEDVILVCSSGYGTSKLLEQRLINVFGNEINITDVVGLRLLEKMDTEQKIIITTVPMESYASNMIYVNPMLTTEDVKKISRIINKESNYGDSFLGLLSNDFFEIETEKTEQNIVIDKMVKKLLKKNYVNPGVFESIIERENMSSTLFGDIAIPHAKMDYVNKPSISVYINKDGINWGTGVARIVFLFLLNEENRNDINDVYTYFNRIIDSKQLLSNLINAENYNDFIKILTEEEDT